jgi:hypothetical protein
MKKLRARELFRNSRFLLIAVESVELHLNKTDTFCQLSGNFVPVAVIVCGPDGNFAFDMEARPTVLNQLSQSIPELDDMITPLRRF